MSRSEGGGGEGAACMRVALGETLSLTFRVLELSSQVRGLKLLVYEALSCRYEDLSC
jgi:hypothetical protein